MELAQYRLTVRKQLAGRYGDQEAAAIIGRLFEDLLGFSAYEWVLSPGRQLDSAQLALMEDAVLQLQEGRPVQYVTGRQQFLGLDIQVREGVLIPRPETEELVRLVGTIGGWNQGQRVCAVDLGTGSGAIALGLSSLYPDWDIYGLDLSLQALEVARRNAVCLNLRATFEAFNLLDGDFGKMAPPAWAGFGLLLSNPPYIPESERFSLDEHVREFEPEIALFVPDEDPLIFYRRLAELACVFGGGRTLLLVECHHLRAGEVLELWTGQGLSELTLHRDAFGKERFVSGWVTAGTRETNTGM